MPTDSFVITLRLEPTKEDINILYKRFGIGSHIHNVMVKEARKRLYRLSMDKEYKTILNHYHTTGEWQKGDKAKLSDIRKMYGLSEYQFHEYLITQKHLFEKHFDINTVQKIATHVWSAVSTYLFRKGEEIHFKKKKDFKSVEGKSNTVGIRYKDNCVYWKGLVIPARIKDKDEYAKEALSTCRIKYARIKRRWHKHNHRFYVQLVMEGVPPLKHLYKEGNDIVGVDPGISTMAIVGKDKVIFTELGDKVTKIEKELVKLNRQSDKLRRLNNPDNFEENGTIKKNTKSFRKTWHNSNKARKVYAKIRMLYAKRSDMLRQQHNILANEVLETCGTNIRSEKMSYKGLQKRSKNTEKSEKTGKYKRKKRFGGSILNHAPSLFLQILEQKLNYVGKSILYLDTRETRLSQLNHITGEYEKAKLSQRWKSLTSDVFIQRDLYSAFLIQHGIDEITIDMQACIDDFEKFKQLHEECISDLRKQKQEGKIFPSCMGI